MSVQGLSSRAAFSEFSVAIMTFGTCELEEERYLNIWSHVEYILPIETLNVLQLFFSVSSVSFCFINNPDRDEVKNLLLRFRTECYKLYI